MIDSPSFACSGRSASNSNSAVGLCCGPEISFERPLRSGKAVQGNVALRDCERQTDSGGGMVYRESPTVAGDVPIEFVVILKESQLAVRCVREFVSMFASWNKSVFVAEVDAFAVGIVLHARRLWLFVAKSGA